MYTHPQTKTKLISKLAGISYKGAGKKTPKKRKKQGNVKIEEENDDDAPSKTTFASNNNNRKMFNAKTATNKAAKKNK